MKRNGHKNGKCRACGTSEVYKDSLCQTCYEQDEASAYYEKAKQDAEPRGFWATLTGWFMLFFPVDDDNGGT